MWSLIFERRLQAEVFRLVFKMQQLAQENSMEQNILPSKLNIKYCRVALRSLQIREYIVSLPEATVA